MILFPAIDLKEGRCVRLVRGERASAKVFHDNPAAQARLFAQAGCRWLHVVDLDGAFAGRSINAAAVEAIRAAVPLKIQFGGGLRSRGAIEHWLQLGIDRLVLGTAAVEDPDLVRRTAFDHPGRIAVAIDARDGRVATHGWLETSAEDAVACARRFADCGVAALVYTDIARDGTQGGVDAEAVAEFAQMAGLPVIASGGVASLDDLARLKAREADGIVGVICGRALYDGRIDAAAALRLLSGSAPSSTSRGALPEMPC